MGDCLKQIHGCRKMTGRISAAVAHRSHEVVSHKVHIFDHPFSRKLFLAFGSWESCYNRRTETPAKGTGILAGASFDNCSMREISPTWLWPNQITENVSENDPEMSTYDLNTSTNSLHQSPEFPVISWKRLVIYTWLHHRESIQHSRKHE